MAGAERRRPPNELDAASALAASARRWWLLPLAAAVAFAGLASDAARVETPTIDEFAHVPAGHAYLEHGAFELYAKNPPLFKLLMALASSGVPGLRVPPVSEPRQLYQGWGPWHYGAAFMQANRSHYFEIFFRARLAAIAAALLTAALLFGWARSLFGDAAASITTALFLLSPSVLAHGHLGTVDVACAASMTGALVALRWAMWRPSPTRALAAGAALGIALLIKFTALLLVPAVVVLVAWVRRKEPRRALSELAWVALAAVVTVNSGMAFGGSMTPLREFRFRSDFARALQAQLPGALPVPLPYAYVAGFDAVKRDSEHGELGSYLLGRWTQRGVWYHDLVALAVKTPLPFLALVAACPFALRRRLQAGSLARGELPWLIVPVATLAIGLIGINQVKLGTRYLLPLLVLLWLLTASVWASLPRRVVLAAGSVSLAWLGWSAWNVHPDYLSFFNALGSSTRVPVLIGSDLDWGQDLYRLRGALDARGHRGPVWLHYFGHVDARLYGVEYRLLPPQPVGGDEPVEGLVAVSASFLAGQPYPVIAPSGEQVHLGRARLQFLRERVPVAQAGTIWLYEIEPPAAGDARGSGAREGIPTPPPSVLPGENDAGEGDVNAGLATGTSDGAMTTNGESQR